MTPLLLLVFGVSPVTAIGTDLLFAGLTKLGASRVHDKAGLVDWPIVKRLWVGSLPASGISIWLLQQGWVHVDIGQLPRWIGLMILFTALGMLAQRRLHQFGAQLRLSHANRFKQLQPLLTVLAGSILGVLVSLTSIGAGALGAVLLTYLYPLRMQAAKLVATDIVHAIPLALFAGLGHMLAGHVNFELLGWLLLGSIPGVWIGAKLSSTLPATPLRLMLAIVLGAIGLKMTDLPNLLTP